MLLRSYTGLFNDYVRIDEVLLARRLNITADELYQNLKYLSQQKIIHYIPKRDAPAIQFLTERIDKSRIRISPVNYRDKKINYLKRVDAVINYARTEEICRSVQLLAYFGERGSKPCGQCDVCKGEHQSGISNLEFQLISEKIGELLRVESLEIREVVRQCEGDEKKVLKVTRWLLDQGILEMNTSDKLVLKKELH